MVQAKYDIIAVGGGLGGASLAKAMAEGGAKVLVLEREKQCRDRVRGEVIWPWGCAELRELGVYDLLARTCAREVRWMDIYFGGTRLEHRDLPATSLQKTGTLNWVHPEIEEVLLAAAERAGVEIRRGASVNEVRTGASPTVSVDNDGHAEEFQARLVVCADGRGSMARKWGDFRVQHDFQAC